MKTIVINSTPPQKIRGLFVSCNGTRKRIPCDCALTVSSTARKGLEFDAPAGISSFPVQGNGRGEKGPIRILTGAHAKTFYQKLNKTNYDENFNAVFNAAKHKVEI